jgi:hypothetical protein
VKRIKRRGCQDDAQPGAEEMVDKYDELARYIDNDTQKPDAKIRVSRCYSVRAHRRMGEMHSKEKERNEFVMEGVVDCTFAISGTVTQGLGTVGVADSTRCNNRSRECADVEHGVVVPLG